MRVEIEPAHIDRVQLAASGELVTIEKDVGGVAEALRRLDAGLRLKYNSDVDECWIVYRVHRNGVPCRDDDPERTEELVLTAKQLDHRIVKRLEYIDGHGRSGYDFVKALEEGRRAREKAEADEFHERVGDAAERTAHALRRDLGLGSYQGRIFKPRDL